MKSFSGTLILLSIFAFVSLSFSSQIRKSDTGIVATKSYYQQGKVALDQGLLLEAEKAFNAGLSETPKDPQNLLGLAEVALKNKDKENAHSYLQKALSIAPENYLVQTAWGRYLYSQGDFEQAESAFIKANQLNPDATAPLIDLATLYATALNQLNKAVDIYRNVLLLDPTLAGTHYALGTSLIKLEKFDEAQVELNEAAHLAPDNPKPYVSLGELYARKKNLKAAQKAFTSALEIEPNLLPALLGRGDVFVTLNQPQNALTDYMKARTVAPNFAPVLAKIGMVHQSQGEYPAARNAYLDAIDINPKIAIAYNNLAFIASEQKEDLKNALIWANEAVTLSPDIPQFQDTLAWVHRARFENKKAIKILETLTTKYSTYPEFYYHLGIIYSETGKVKKAVQNLEKSISLHKNNNFVEIEDARLRLSKIK